MTVPIISHSHEGIRINIDGVVSVFSNPVYLAEAHARLLVQSRESAMATKLANEPLCFAINKIPQVLLADDDLPEQTKQLLQELSERIDTLATVVTDMQQRMG